MTRLLTQWELVMKLTKEDIGKKFNTQENGLVTMISHHHYESLFSCEDDAVIKQLNKDGKCENSEWQGYDVISRYDPRSWLSDMPNLGDIKEGWLACDESNYWSIYERVDPIIKGSAWGNGVGYSELPMFNMPSLTGDQWKDSKISVAELRQWQDDNS